MGTVAGLWALGTGLLLSQVVGQPNIQVGALYSGGDNSRPRLNKNNCGTFGSPPAVDFQVVVNNAGATLPVGVLYREDVSIPAQVVTTTPTPGTPTPVTTAVTCAEPTSSNIIRDNIPITGTTLTFTLVSQYPNIPSVSDVMQDLCERTDGGVRKRRAYCFGVRNGTGGATQSRGGDGPDIDTIAPGPPANIRAESGDSYLTVTLLPPNGTDAVEGLNMRYVPEIRECDASLFVDGGVLPDAGPAGDGGTAVDVLDPFCGEWRQVGGPVVSPLSLTNLENGKHYEVRAWAVDDFDNSGPRGGSAFGHPIKEYGLLDLYGQPVYGGSCSQLDTTSTVALLGAVWLVCTRWTQRRGKRTQA